MPFPEVGAAPFDCARMAVGNGVSAMQSQCRESTQARSMARFASVANSVHGHAPSSLALHPFRGAREIERHHAPHLVERLSDITAGDGGAKFVERFGRGGIQSAKSWT